MNGIATAQPPSFIRSCLTGIQSKFYSIQHKLCNTDTRIYAFLILGRVLQATALMATVASIAFTFLVGPATLAGLVPAIAVGILGTYVAGNPQELNEIIQMGRPFVAGQPVGLNNNGNNCWLNSGLQILAHIPAFEARMRQIPEFAQFLDSYRAARAASQKVSPIIDSHQIRQHLSTQTRGGVDAGHVQEDAAQLFEYLFEGQDHALYRFEHQLNGLAAVPRSEPMIQLDIEGGRPIPAFPQLFNSFFNHTTDRGQFQELFFPSAPNDLLIQIKRFYRDRDGTQGKINDPIEVPLTFRPPNSCVRGESASYECNAFLIHHGQSQDGGHYVAYVKIGNVWWYCADSRVIEVSAKEAQDAVKESYILHYARSRG
jgi:hypothetical protein